MDYQPVLTAPDFRLGSRTSFTLYRCRACGLVSLQPQPTAEVFAASYPDWLWESVRGREASPTLKFKPAVALLRRWHPQPGRLLDVGCGPGDFVMAVEKLEWQARGIEISRRQVEAGVQRGAAVEFCDDFTRYSTGERYDAITFNHVLEHVPSPRAHLAQARKLLKPGGIVLISAPNFNSLTRRILGAYWTHADLPRHLFHFTPATLTRLLNSLGFRVAQISFPDHEQDSLGARESMRRWVVHGLLRRPPRPKRHDSVVDPGAESLGFDRVAHFLYRRFGDAVASSTELLRIADTFTVVATL